MDPSMESTNATDKDPQRVQEIAAEGRQWARAVDDHNAWDSLVLTLGTFDDPSAYNHWCLSDFSTDGVGIRGYSSLLILLEVMKKIVE